MILEGTLDRFPNLTVVAAHGGGYLPSYLGRTEVACAARGEAANCANQKLPSEYLRDQILVDTMVFSHAGLRHLHAEMGASYRLHSTSWTTRATKKTYRLAPGHYCETPAAGIATCTNKQNTQVNL